jgi:uncharacterized membrane protein YidH (DUF202 family)
LGTGGAPEFGQFVRQSACQKPYSVHLKRRDLLNAQVRRATQVLERGTMKAATIVGILLILVGIIGFAMGGISFTHEKKDVDLGPLQVQHKQTRTVPISPILSTIALVGGIGLVVVGARSKA